MIYLASPYWHEEVKVRLHRTEQTMLIARALLRRKLPIFSPIIHGHALNEGGLNFNSQKPASPDIGFSHQDWLDVDFQYLKVCSMMMIAQIEGWQSSKGVNMEKDFCRVNGIPMVLLSPVECSVLADSESKLLYPAIVE